ncbi:hypothetical protein [Methylocystis iwaonis]|nr:hypothetical protein [Methylocystis iwaonis]
MTPQIDRLTVRIFSLVEAAAEGRVAIAATVFLVAVTIGAAVYAYSA